MLSQHYKEYQLAASGKEPAYQCGRHKSRGFDPWVRKIPWRRAGSPLHYSCLENPMDRGAWRATVHSVSESRTQLKWLCMHTNDTIIKIQCVEWSPGQMIQFLPYINDSKMKRRSNSHKVQETYEMYQPTRVVMITSGYLMILKNYSWGFPGVSVVKNLLTNAGDTGPGRSYMPQSNKACVPQFLSLCSRARKLQLLSPCASEPRPAARESTAMRSPCTKA